MNREEELKKAWKNLPESEREYPDIICQIEMECFTQGFNAAWDLLYGHTVGLHDDEEYEDNQIQDSREKIDQSFERMKSDQVSENLSGHPLPTFILKPGVVTFPEKPKPKFAVGDKVKLKGFSHIGIVTELPGADPTHSDYYHVSSGGYICKWLECNMIKLKKKIKPIFAVGKRIKIVGAVWNGTKGAIKWTDAGKEEATVETDDQSIVIIPFRYLIKLKRKSPLREWTIGRRSSSTGVVEFLILNERSDMPYNTFERIRVREVRQKK